MDVAVKTLSENATEAEKIQFLQEAVIMGQFVHPNIIQLHGIVTRGDPVSNNRCIGMRRSVHQSMTVARMFTYAYFL